MSNVQQEKKPRIRVLGEHGMEEIDYDHLPDPEPVAYDLAHHFLPVKISARAIDMASKIIPQEYATKQGGLHSLLSKRANEIFQKMTASDRSGVYGKMKYIFDFDKDGPVLKTVGLI